MALIYINFYTSAEITNAGVMHQGQQSRTKERRFDQSGHRRKVEGSEMERRCPSYYVHSDVVAVKRLPAFGNNSAGMSST